VTQGEVLIDGVAFEVAIADRGYDKKALVEAIEAKGAEAVIPTQRNRAQQRAVDPEKYKDRNIAERFWSRIKQYRRVATRYDKTDECYLGFVHLASIVVMLR
jgi:transposase